MYRVRIEHSGYDEKPFEFEYKMDLSRFVEALTEVHGIGDKLTLTIEKVEDKDTG